MVAGKGGPQSLRAEEMTDSMANLGEQLWRHSDQNTTSAIRLVALKYTVRCERKVTCSQRATVGVECRDKIGHSIWRKDFCGEHARPIIERAQARGIEGFWH
jgi:hypothetical protein